MPMRFFPAVIEAAEDGGYGVFFPDLPGCISAGDTVQAAATNAADALALHLAGMIEDKEAIPQASSPDAPLPDWAGDVRIAARVLVPVEMPGRTVRVNITLDEGILARLDAAAAADGASRSGFIAGAVREVLRGRVA